MDKVYTFNDVAISIIGAPDTLLEHIVRYTYLAQAAQAAGQRITVNWSEDFSAAPAVPANAATVFSTRYTFANGLQTQYSSHRLGMQVWKNLEGYALVTIDTLENAVSVWRNPDGEFNMEALVILFAAPVANLLANFGYWRLHAAAAQVGGCGILITGLSGRGKSTAAYALLASGNRVVTDETAIVRQSGDHFECSSILNTAKIGASSLNAFFRNLDVDFYKQNDDHYCRLPAVFPATCGRVEKIDAVFALEQTGRIDSEIVPASPMEIMPELLPTSMDISSDRNMEGAFSAVSALLDGAACAKVLFGTDMMLFVRAIEAFLLKI